MSLVGGTPRSHRAIVWPEVDACDAESSTTTTPVSVSLVLCILVRLVPLPGQLLLHTHSFSNIAKNCSRSGNLGIQSITRPTKDPREGDTAKDRPTKQPSKVLDAPTACTRYETGAGETGFILVGRTEETTRQEQVILGDILGASPAQNRTDQCGRAFPPDVVYI